ncbi:NAD-dependent epimerase/dehydratase family protein [Streptomyces phyllanthi]|uniref:NAD-dependent epimerase/dehydratase family protein n=1 Tax=Streptomyces phyllanthi TaxID=1803180 RepID=A0A5N8WHP0_9ACTN|nr:NAD-dependent epimerase/dehydratase family protein [Streptomyces phyllanthi]MPY46727.1 NAD-dependent epimerase/dehydratase family protein [Streptomyces phyllanthi]
MPEICVIGGNRYFGRHLIRRLQAAGARVTVVNRGSAPPPPGTDHVIADRDDEEALGRALGARTFDAVVDQVCYTPLQAAVARRVFAGRTARYVMTSTMEVYDPATFSSPGSSAAFSVPAPVPVPAPAPVPVPESVVDPVRWPVRWDLPWASSKDLSRLLGEATAYAEGKRQAEAVFARDAVFPFVSVRSAHVLGGGPRDFTGRLRHYVDRVTAGRPVSAHREPAPTSFVHHEEIAAFLHWTATRPGLTGPVNAASHGALTVTDLCEAIATATGSPAPSYRAVRDGEPASPFSFDRSYAMSNARAAGLGFAFTEVSDWLAGAVTETAAEIAAEIAVEAAVEVASAGTHGRRA